MMRDERGMGLIRVIIWFLTVLFSLWIFSLLLGRVLEPIRKIALSFDAVSSMGYDSGVNLLWPIVSKWAPLLLAVGAILLIIIYAVFQEQFRGARRPHP